MRGGGRGGRGERGAWRPSGGQEALWRVVCAEAAGAALLVLLSCVPACTEPPAELLQRALAAGLVVALLVQCLDHISGAQLNPTVTLAAALWGRVGWGRAACMAGAQLCGAACGAVALAALLPGGASAAGACNTVPAAGLGAARAAALEGALGGCLALANCAAWDPRNAQLRDSWPLRIGTAVAAMSLVASELTGASMNPARSLGPALVTGRWGQHWVSHSHATRTHYTARARRTRARHFVSPFFLLILNGNVFIYNYTRCT